MMHDFNVEFPLARGIYYVIIPVQKMLLFEPKELFFDMYGRQITSLAVLEMWKNLLLTQLMKIKCLYIHQIKNILVKRR